MHLLQFIFPILAASSVVLLIVIKIYFKIRELLPISVNCWFCNQSAKVPYHHYNSWICPGCDQYNGFLEDGGYNRVIPAQFDEYLNVPSASTRFTKFKRQGPTLCDSCNINQQLKVSQLASFAPLDMSNYDSEVEVYSKQLDKVYEVCKNCEGKISELFEKEKELFPDLAAKPSVFESTKNVAQKLIHRRPWLLYYGTIISCMPQLLDVLLRNVPKDTWKTLLDNAGSYIILPNSIDLSSYKYIINNIHQFYIDNHCNLHFGLIGFCIFVYFVEFIKRRTILNVLNISVWCILLSLKYFTMPLDSYHFDINVLQGVTAAVFLFLNSKHNFKVICKKRVCDENKCNIKYQNNLSNKKVSKTTVTTSAFAAVTKTRDRSIPSKQRLPEFVSTRVTRSNANLNLQNTNGMKPIDEFGFSNLHLGTRKLTSTKNHLSSKPKPFFNPSNDLWNGNSVLAPPKLNVDDKNFTSSSLLSPAYDRSPTQTRCSSQTSGVCSLSSTPEPQEHDFNRYSDFPLSDTNPNRTMQSNFYTHYDPVYQQTALSPYTYYQFAAMYHRMCSPPSPSSYNVSQNYSDATNKTVMCSHNLFFSVLISIVVICNFSLVGLMYYKEFAAKSP